MIRELAQGIDGLVAIAVTLPGQAIRTFDAIRHVPMGDTMENYYYTPQLFKMPAKYRRPAPPTESSPPIGAFEEGTVTKALPYIALGIAGIVAYNIIKK
jgi:hypothetical protein